MYTQAQLSTSTDPSVPLLQFVMQVTSVPRWPIRSGSSAPQSPSPTTHHQLWLTASHRRWAIYLFMLLRDKVNDPSQQNKNTKGGKPERLLLGWTVWRSSGFLWEGLEQEGTCEENFQKQRWDGWCSKAQIGGWREDSEESRWLWKHLLLEAESVDSSVTLRTVWMTDFAVRSRLYFQWVAL